jgi:hypothetical protein
VITAFARSVGRAYQAEKLHRRLQVLDRYLSETYNSTFNTNTFGGRSYHHFRGAENAINDGNWRRAADHLRLLIELYNLPAGNRVLQHRQQTLALLNTMSGTIASLRAVKASPAASASRQARLAASIAVRLLPPAHRERYHQEHAAELADTPAADQSAHARRLVRSSWATRRALAGNPS